MRAFLVDTLATVAFFTLIAGLSELLIAGMSPAQVLATRALTVPVMVLTGRPYGRWRDALFVRARPAGPVGRAALDVAAFVSFQVPVYAATLALAGATPAQMAAALGSATVLMLLLARPFGLFLDAARRLAGTAPH